MKLSLTSVQLHATVLVYFCATAPTLAQTVYRCGSNYSDTPCPQSVSVLAADPRTQAQKTQTDRATTQTATLATQLEKSRLADEAEADRRAQAQTKESALGAKTTPTNKPDNEAMPHKKNKKNKKAATGPLQQTKKPKLNKPQKPQSFTATVPVPKKSKP